MNELAIFESEEFGAVRAVTVEGKPHFVGVDVARALGYAYPSQAVGDHCKGIAKLPIPSVNQHGAEVMQETNVIPEGDVYRLIVKAADQSRSAGIKEKAERFERWVFDDVLPSIRKTGSYSAPGKEAEKERRLMAKEERLAARQKLDAARLLERLSASYEGTSYAGVLKAHAVDMIVPGLLPLPESGERHYSASEVGAVLGVTANMVGRIANRRGLKTGEHGGWFHDKSPHSAKEIEAFRYNELGVEAVRRAIEDERRELL
jgi:prophage antirepressor-like protein